MLMANCLAQGEALMNGRGMAELKDDGTDAQLKCIVPFQATDPLLLLLTDVCLPLHWE